MYRGYVKLWRKTLDSPIIGNLDLLGFWFWCLLKASHKECKMMVGYQEVTLQPGDFVFGRKKAAEELKTSEQKIRTFLKYLRKLENLTIKTTNKFSIISITKWDTYQVNEIENNQQINQHLTSSQPATNHKQECKEWKNVKNKNELLRSSPRSRKGNGSKALSICLCFENFQWEGIQDRDLELWNTAYPACDLQIELKKMAAWCKANPQKGRKKNWEKFITNWLARSQDKGGTRGISVPEPENEWDKIAREEREERNRLRFSKINKE